ncbi:MAG: hypothetical protein L6Q40_00075 [Azonexus sp.]|nr:hypothetical protein [Azonexus sp.]
MRKLLLLTPVLLTACTTVHEPLRYTRGEMPGMRMAQGEVVATRDIRLPPVGTTNGQSSGWELGTVTGTTYAATKDLPLGTGIVIALGAGLVAGTVGLVADSMDHTRPGQAIDYRLAGETTVRTTEQAIDGKPVKVGDPVTIEIGSFVHRIRIGSAAR